MSQTRRHLEHHPGINPAPFKATIESVTDEGVILSDSWCYPKGGGAAGGHGDLPIRWRRIPVWRGFCLVAHTPSCF